MNIDIDLIIYGYLFICIALMCFNIFYIFYSAGMKRKLVRDTRWWKSKILEQLEFVVNKTEVSTPHRLLLEKRLKNTNQLLVYSYALDEIRDEKRDVREYVNQTYFIIQELAHIYEKKDNMDKAFFAYFISENTPCYGDEYRPIMEILVAFLENSTVYCRENVLKAFYAFGNVDMLVHVLGLFDERGIMHHRKLLADGLMTFRGDKEKLAALLWQKCNEWNQNFVLAVIQFIAATSDNYKEIFFKELQDEDTDIEAKLAIIRYFQNHVYEPMRPILQGYLENIDEGDISVAIVSASVLLKYPGDDTEEVLSKALRHSNWNVRYNAASTLASLADGREELSHILEGDDRYAKEILTYMLEEKGTLV